MDFLLVDEKRFEKYASIRQHISFRSYLLEELPIDNCKVIYHNGDSERAIEIYLRGSYYIEKRPADSNEKYMLLAECLLIAKIREDYGLV